jgi:hypothetical protein
VPSIWDKVEEDNKKQGASSGTTTPDDDWKIFSNEATKPKEKGLIEQYWDRMNPAAQARGVVQTIEHPVDKYSTPTAHLLQEAQDSFDKASKSSNLLDKMGHGADGVRHTLSYFLNGFPGVGEILDEAGNKAASGDYKGAIADTAALATMIASGHYGPKVLDAATEPGAANAAVKATTQAAKGAVVKAAQVATDPRVYGGAEMAAGGYLVTQGHPWGIVPFVSGLRSLAKGLRESVENGTPSPIPFTPKPYSSAVRDVAWQEHPEPSATPPAEAAPITGELPSGRAPGSIAAQNVPPTPAPPPRAPAWQEHPEPTATPPPEAAPITGELSSGRAPGSIAAQNVPPTPAPPPRAPAWQDIQSTTPAPPPLVTPPQATLPSGRVPGSLATQVTPTDTTTGEVLRPLPSGEFRTIPRPGVSTPAENTVPSETAPKIVTSRQIASEAADTGLPVDDIQKKYVDDGYEIRDLNADLHGAIKDLGGDHTTLHNIAVNRYGHESFANMTDPQLMELQDNLPQAAMQHGGSPKMATPPMTPAASAALQNNPRALAAAQALQAEMTKNATPEPSMGDKVAQAKAKVAADSAAIRAFVDQLKPGQVVEDASGRKFTVKSVTTNPDGTKTVNY